MQRQVITRPVKKNKPHRAREGPSEAVTFDVTEGAPPSSGTASTSDLRQEFDLGRARRPVRPQSGREGRGHGRQRRQEGPGQVITLRETLLRASSGDQRRGSKGDALTIGFTIPLPGGDLTEGRRG